MRTLYHYPLCPFSRKVRVVLAEKKLEFDPVIEVPWDARDEFLKISPQGEIPVLVQDGAEPLSDSTAIAEYLDEVHREPPLLPSDPLDRAEVRRLVGLFDAKFNREVTIPLIGEKIIKRLSQPKSEPDSKAIRSGFAAIHRHLDTIAWLSERRTWLAGPHYSLADIAAAAHLSCIDYLGDVPWEGHQGAKDWYVRVKSRPAFRTVLTDHLPGLPPARNYANLDF